MKVLNFVLLYFLLKSWNLVEKPLNQQKPSALVKKKSSKKQQRRNRNADRAAKMGIEYIKKS